MYQLLNGMAHCHMQGFLHRDVKPHNILVTDTLQLKIADFGLSRNFSLPIPIFTHEVVTLWYRAPEILLGSPQYSTPVDVRSTHDQTKKSFEIETTKIFFHALNWTVADVGGRMRVC
jgi:serine/threonine protein kinase